MTARIARTRGAGESVHVGLGLINVLVIRRTADHVAGH